MRTTSLHLVILDDRAFIASQLSSYLRNRFGSRISVTVCSDASTCMKCINEQSHVFILDYLLNDKENQSKHRLNIYNILKRRNPRTEVMFLTSEEDVSAARIQMQNNIIRYVKEKEKYLHDISLLQSLFRPY